MSDESDITLRLSPGAGKAGYLFRACLSHLKPGRSMVILSRNDHVVITRNADQLECQHKLTVSKSEETP